MANGVLLESDMDFCKDNEKFAFEEKYVEKDLGETSLNSIFNKYSFDTS